MKKKVAIAVWAISLSACTPLPVSRDQPAESGSAGTASSQPDGTKKAVAPSAVLLQQARSHVDAGEYPAATASLERAVRIEPGNAWLWLELAKVHLASGNLRQARAHAYKAASLAGGNGAAREEADNLLAEIARRQP